MVANGDSPYKLACRNAQIYILLLFVWLFRLGDFIMLPILPVQDQIKGPLQAIVESRTFLLLTVRWAKVCILSWAALIMPKEPRILPI